MQLLGEAKMGTSSKRPKGLEADHSSEMPVTNDPTAVETVASEDVVPQSTIILQELLEKERKAKAKRDKYTTKLREAETELEEIRQDINAVACANETKQIGSHSPFNRRNNTAQLLTRPKYHTDQVRQILKESKGSVTRHEIFVAAIKRGWFELPDDKDKADKVKKVELRRISDTLNQLASPTLDRTKLIAKHLGKGKWTLVRPRSNDVPKKGREKPVEAETALES